MLENVRTPVFLALNKIDLLDENELDKAIDRVKKQFDFEGVFSN